MKTAKLLIFFASSIWLMLVSAADASESCSKRELRAPDTDTIELDALKNGVREQPAFYLRDTQSGRVLFFKPEDLLSVFEEETAKYQARYPTVTFATSGRPIDWIREDLPLKEDTDLMKYVLRDSKFAGELDVLVPALIDKGHAAVDFVGDEHDPTTIKRVNWTKRDSQGRRYCDGEGRKIYEVVDIIIVGGHSDSRSPN